MEKRTLHKACRIIFYVAILNFLLFFLTSLFIGGDALNGKIEEGHYYVGNHGNYTEVSHIVFTCSKLHGLSVCLTYPLAMLAGLVYWVAGGWEQRLKTVTALVREPPSNPVLYVLHTASLFLWKTIDFFESIFWWLFDSWRKPDVEFFARFSRKRCVAKLSEALDQDLSSDRLDRPICGFLSGSHFYLYKRPLYRRGGPFFVLFGKLSSSTQGTYVRGWHRFPAFGMLVTIVTIVFSLVIVVALLGPENLDDLSVAVGLRATISLESG
jgi:hypothetical protein